MALSDQADGELARAASAGSREAESELYRRLAPRARLYGLRHLRDEAAASDLAHEVWLMTIESLRAGRVREPDRIASFVLGACRMRARDTRRTEKRQSDLLERNADALTPEQEELAAPEKRLEGCLDHLPERQRTVLVMSFYAERTASEIASELGTSPGNVRVLRHRALADLGACMERR